MAQMTFFANCHIFKDVQICFFVKTVRGFLFFTPKYQNSFDCALTTTRNTFRDRPVSYEGYTVN